jgi:putative membrane protein
MSRSRAIAASMAAGAVAAVLTANVAFADGRDFGGGFGGRRRDGGFLFLFPLLMLLAVAALLVVLWRGRHPLTAPAPPPPVAGAVPAQVSPTHNAETILADRLARGEIQPDDYRAAITVLRETAPPG